MLNSNERPLHNFLFCSFAALCSNFNARNILNITALKIFPCLVKKQNSLSCKGLKEPHRYAFISAGSNIGDKLANCQRGIEAINALNTCAVTDISSYYKTSPVDYLEQDWFINCAVKIQTSDTPEELLTKLKEIEKKIGTSDKKIKFGPRVLDLDIIFYEDMIINAEPLKIPHPRMYNRHFVLQPLCDIAPDFIHPILKTDMKSLLNNLKKDIHSKSQEVTIIK